MCFSNQAMKNAITERWVSEKYDIGAASVTLLGGPYKGYNERFLK